MTEHDPVPAVERGFRRSDAFEPLDDGRFESQMTPFDATVSVERGASAVEIRVCVETPTIRGVVEGEHVAAIVNDEWYRTLVRRLADAPNVTRTDDVPEPSVTREGERVRVETTFETLDPAAAVDDARALMMYVEGTWMEGIIPGYEYGEPAASLLSQAVSGDNAEEGARKGGMPL